MHQWKKKRTEKKQGNTKEREKNLKNGKVEENIYKQSKKKNRDGTRFESPLWEEKFCSIFTATRNMKSEIKTSKCHRPFDAMKKVFQRKKQGML